MQRAQGRVVHGERVYGLDVDEATRCAHWHGPTDIIALRMQFWGKWFPCHECHQAIADHDASVWPRSGRATEAILCGACGKALRIDQYLDGESRCHRCDAAFNPGCAKHWDLYFEIT
jgi:uncharacterized CHY-type Zn-finger protein